MDASVGRTSLGTSIIKMGDTPSQIIAYPVYAIYTVIEVGLRMVVMAILLKSSYEFIMLSCYYLVNGITFSKQCTFEEEKIEKELLFDHDAYDYRSAATRVPGHPSTQTLYEENQALKNTIEEMEKSKAKMNEKNQEYEQENEKLKNSLYEMGNYVMLLTTFIIITGVHIVKLKIDIFIWKKLKKDEEFEEPSPEPAPAPNVVMGEFVQE
jgi:hypothetical protein